MEVIVGINIATHRSPNVFIDGLNCTLNIFIDFWNCSGGTSLIHQNDLNISKGINVWNNLRHQRLNLTFTDFQYLFPFVHIPRGQIPAHLEKYLFLAYVLLSLILISMTWTPDESITEIVDGFLRKSGSCALACLFFLLLSNEWEKFRFLFFSNNLGLLIRVFIITKY